jgi:cell division protein FtsI (penicillin-binding protein 3)
VHPVEQSPELARVRWLARGALLWGALIFGRLVWLQVVQHDELARLADSQQVRELALRGPRGTIVDRNGGKLAVSRPALSLAINPRLLKDPTVAAELLGRILKIDSAVLAKRIRGAGQNRRGFLRVKRTVTAAEAERLRALKADWIDLREGSQREYPKGTLAAHLLGSVDHQEKGNAGLEQSLQEDLEGRAGYIEMLTDVRHNGVETRVTAPPQPGKTVALTIDERLQYICDRELKKAVDENHAQTGTIVVMDPHNGEVLALSSYPTYDPNDGVIDEKDESRANVAVTYACEPGSVFKIFTIATALETTRLRPQTVINCGRGIINLHGQVIHDLHAYSALTMEEVLWRSSNIGAVNVALTIGKERLYEYLRRFGFGVPTGVVVPGESAGLLRSPDRWTKGSIGYVSFGHEVMSTTMQLAQGASVIANGGYRVKPKMVLWRERPGGKRETEPTADPVRVLRPETAVTMRQMMEGVVLKGTGKRAKLAGYTVGGKTGTAQIFDRSTGRYFAKVHNSTFLGMAPLTNPAIVVVVTINGTSKQGGQVSAPVFKEVASAALRLTGVTRDLPDAEPAPADEPQRTGETMLAKQGPPSEPEEEAAPEGEDGLLVGPRVPDWSGKSVRAVLRESMESGLPVEIMGTGLVRGQSPAAGRILRAGERIRVQFAR